MVFEKREALRDLITSIHDLKDTDVEVLCGTARFLSLKKGNTLVHQGEKSFDEYFLLQGKCRNIVRDAKGREVTLGFTVGPGVVPPNIARTRDGESLVDVEALEDSEFALIGAAKLMELMVMNAGIRDWGNTVLHRELQHKSDREWSLAALSAKEKLEWFRRGFQDGEATFSHAHIASYLGITPVTLSRLRKRE